MGQADLPKEGQGGKSGTKAFQPLNHSPATPEIKPRGKVLGEVGRQIKNKRRRSLNLPHSFDGA
ncbi:MAG: hypothetical protein ACKODZ_07635, partial [Verrucomicrobiota bacterium]